ncbi:MAG TPA: tetratricopeptide repeat protein, partial [Alphaproteobacteria bacterium]|nr:tetratricopeptide repeat protein [Alphaproteobacteria bacterium]
MLRSVFYDANVNGARWRKPYLGLETSSLVDADSQRFRSRRNRASDACLKYRWVPLEEPAPKTKRFFLGAMLATALLIAALPTAAQDFQKGMEAYRLGAFATALEHWKRLAEGGHAVAQNNVGTMYQLGEGVQQDLIEAAKWYRKAAEQGLVYAQSNLALMYFTGEGVGRNYTLAAKWYRKAAEQGNAQDQFSL